MLSNLQLQNLLTSLQKLYADFTLKSLHRRIQSNQLLKHTNSTADISKPITKHVHHLADNHQKSAPKTTRVKSILKAEKTRQHTTHNDDKKTSSENIIKPLSDYLKNKTSIDSTNAGVADKLMLSTWDHFHAAIREGRQGNRDAATMHADIANHAMKEATHYLTKEDFQGFYSKIKKEIDELNKLQQKSPTT